MTDLAKELFGADEPNYIEELKAIRDAFCGKIPEETDLCPGCGKPLRVGLTCPECGLTQGY